MKFIFMFMFLLASNTQAQKYIDVPPEVLKDAVITVTTTTGKTYQFDANSWKLVKRTSHDEVRDCSKCEPKLVVKEVPVEKIKEVVKEVEKPYEVVKRVGVYYRHNVGVVFGRGPTSLDTKDIGSDEVRVTRKYGYVIGGRYAYSLTQEYDVSFELLSNRTFLGGVSIGF